MTKKVTMWRKLGPRIIPGPLMEADEFMEEIVADSNQSQGSVLGVLAEVDRIVARALKSGRTVKLPNGMVFRPVGKKDGSIRIKAYASPGVDRTVNDEPFVKWENYENINKTEAEMIALWNERYPNKPIKD